MNPRSPLPRGLFYSPPQTFNLIKPLHFSVLLTSDKSHVDRSNVIVGLLLLATLPTRVQRGRVAQAALWRLLFLLPASVISVIPPPLRLLLPEVSRSGWPFLKLLVVLGRRVIRVTALLDHLVLRVGREIRASRASWLVAVRVIVRRYVTAVRRQRERHSRPLGQLPFP